MESHTPICGDMTVYPESPSTHFNPCGGRFQTRHPVDPAFVFVVGRAATRAWNATHESADLMIPEDFTLGNLPLGIA